MAHAFHKVAVVGAGAVGSYFGGMLARSGVKVVLIGREGHIQAIRADGLLLDSVRFQEKVQVQATTDLAAVAQADLVLFSVKSYDTAAAASLMTTQLAQDAIIVSLQNGVENAEIISRATGRRALPAVVYVAVELVAPGHVRHKARGDLIVGDPAGRDRPGSDVARVAALFESAQIPCRVSQNIQGDLWFKLIVNAAGNGVTALARASYGEVAKHLLGREVMGAVVREAEAVARAAGVELPAGDLVSEVLSLAEAMGDAHSSTLQDILRGKRTEIGELNGYIAEMGRKYGVATPVNSTIHSLVRILEAGVIERLR